MKTFEEALGLFYREVQIGPHDDFDAIETQQGNEMEENLGRLHGTLNEISTDPMVHKFIHALWQTGRRQPNYNFLVLAINAFAHGVAVGIEMEKAEFPEFEED